MFEKRYLYQVDLRAPQSAHRLFGDSNLEALCDLCHAEEHSKRKPSFEFDENGMLIGCGREDDECKKEHGKKE